MLDEVIPQAVERFGADADRVAIGGISMGGFGAFAIARRRPARFCAVGGHSAAFWLSSGDTAPGHSTTPRTSPGTTSSASPGRADMRHRAALACGWTAARADPFRVADERFASALGIRMRHWAGGHTGAYWQRHYKRYLRFYASALAAC